MPRQKQTVRRLSSGGAVANVAERGVTMTYQELALIKEIREETEAPYRMILNAIKAQGLDHDAIIDHIREHSIVYA